jgi:Coenzyme PQQ synthesis protein D (PqqD)
MTWDEAGERAVILDAQGSTLITLNPVGSILWQELGEPKDADALTTHLCDTFPEVDPAQIRHDVNEFVDTLLAEGLLVAVPERP